MTPISTTNYAARIQHHCERLQKLSRDQESMVLHHFLGGLQAMCEPTSCINPGPSRKAILRALERAINHQTGT